MNETNMAKKILFISNKKTNFFSAMIKDHLQKESFGVIYLDFDINALNKLEDIPNLILLHFEKSEQDDKQFLFYVKELCIEHGKRVFLCGYDSKIKDILSVFPKNTVANTFIRPFVISDLINLMNKSSRKVYNGRRKTPYSGGRRFRRNASCYKGVAFR